MAAGELSNQVYTAPQAPDYLSHYAEIMRSIPDPGKQMAQAQLAQAQIEKANAEYEFMKQKAKEFTEQYPAFKDYQQQKWALELAKLRREGGMDPYRRDHLQAQTDLLRARVGEHTDTGGGDVLSNIPRRPLPGGGGGGGGNVNPFFQPRPPGAAAPAEPGPVAAPPLRPIVPESNVDPTAITTVAPNPDEAYFAGR